MPIRTETQWDLIVSGDITNVASAIGGVVGSANESNFIMGCSNAGQIIVERKTSGYAGGIVGFVNSAMISYCYNANSVLYAYTINEDLADSATVNAGGIAGTSIGSISNCANTGLIGAGNYASTKVARAGGIVGYGQGARVSNSVNDGPVEALSLMTDIVDKTVLNVEVKGSMDTNWVSDPTNSEISVALVYPDDDRRVYANGIGNGMSAAGVYNYSTNYNIKNDGWIGLEGQLQTITLDRNAMIDNKNMGLEGLSEDDKKAKRIMSDAQNLVSAKFALSRNDDDIDIKTNGYETKIVKFI